jgi:host factor-I protein
MALTESRTTDPRSPQSAASALPNIQDAFLNQARRDRIEVTICLMDGRHFEARIKNFDKFAVIVDVNGADHLIFKHAISTIETQRSVASYFPPQQA